MNVRAFLPIQSIVAYLLSIAIGTAWYMFTCHRLEHNAGITLANICAAKKEKIKLYFSTLEQQVSEFAQNPKTIDAAIEFKQAFETIEKKINRTSIDALKGDLYLYYQDAYIRQLNYHLKQKITIDELFPTDPVTVFLQGIYIAHNPNSSSEKSNLVSAPEGDEYNTIHTKYHPFFHNEQQKKHYYDILLADRSSGAIYYTVSKETDFANNLIKSTLRQSNLAYLIYSMNTSDQSKINDFQPYNPSYAMPAGFIATPVIQHAKEIGVLAVHLSADIINRIMTDNNGWLKNGLGNTGEVYLVSNDLTMRSISRFFIENKYAFLQNQQKLGDQLTIDNMRNLDTTILLQKVDTPQVQAALSGKSGVMKSKNYLNNKIIAAYAPVFIQGLHWVIIAEQELKEICGKTLRNTIYGILAMVALITFLSALAYVYRNHKKKQAHMNT